MRLPGGRAQLVGLLPSRGLVQLLAQAHRLGMVVEGLPPAASTCRAAGASPAASMNWGSPAL